MTRIFEEIKKKREWQDKKWGEQNHEMGVKHKEMKKLADEMKRLNNRVPLCWHTILMEEVYEAFAETDPVKQRK